MKTIDGTPYRCVGMAESAYDVEIRPPIAEGAQRGRWVKIGEVCLFERKWYFDDTTPYRSKREAVEALVWAHLNEQTALAEHVPTGEPIEIGGAEHERDRPTGHSEPRKEPLEPLDVPGAPIFGKRVRYLLSPYSRGVLVSIERRGKDGIPVATVEFGAVEIVNNIDQFAVEE